MTICDETRQNGREGPGSYMAIVRYQFKFRMNEVSTDRQPLTRRARIHTHVKTLLLWRTRVCIFISIIHSILCSGVCSLMDRRFLSLRERLSAISPESVFGGGHFIEAVTYFIFDIIPV